MTAFVAGDEADALEQSGELVVGFEGLAESVVTGFREHPLDDHVVGHGRFDLRLNRAISLERVERGRQLDKEQLPVAGGHEVREVSVIHCDLIEPTTEELDNLGTLPTTGSEEVLFPMPTLGCLGLRH